MCIMAVSVAVRAAESFGCKRMVVRVTVTIVIDLSSEVCFYV